MSGYDAFDWVSWCAGTRAGPNGSAYLTSKQFKVPKRQREENTIGGWCGEKGTKGNPQNTAKQGLWREEILRGKQLLQWCVCVHTCACTCVCVCMYVCTQYTPLISSSDLARILSVKSTLLTDV